MEESHDETSMDVVDSGGSTAWHRDILRQARVSILSCEQKKGSRSDATQFIRRILAIQPTDVFGLVSAGRLSIEASEAVDIQFIRLYVSCKDKLNSRFDLGWLHGVSELRAEIATRRTEESLHASLLIGGYGALLRQVAKGTFSPTILRRIAVAFPSSERIYRFAASVPLDGEILPYLERLSNVLTLDLEADAEVPTLSRWRHAKSMERTEISAFLGRLYCMQKNHTDVTIFDDTNSSSRVIRCGRKSVHFHIANERVDFLSRYFTAIEPALISRVLEITPRDVFLDVGANIGLYSILAAAMGARCVAIEPFPANCTELKRNISANNLTSKIKVIQAAVGRRAEKGRMAYSRDIAGIGAQNLEHSDRFHDKSGRPEMWVSVEKVDDLISRGIIPSPSFVKIDVDGDEANVLTGMEKLLCDRPPRLLMVESAPGSATRSGITKKLKRVGYTRTWGDSAKNMYFEI